MMNPSKRNPDEGPGDEQVVRVTTTRTTTRQQEVMPAGGAAAAATAEAEVTRQEVIQAAEEIKKNKQQQERIAAADYYTPLQQKEIIGNKEQKDAKNKGLSPPAPAPHLPPSHPTGRKHAGTTDEEPEDYDISPSSRRAGNHNNAPPPVSLPGAYALSSPLVEDNNDNNEPSPTIANADTTTNINAPSADAPGGGGGGTAGSTTAPAPPPVSLPGAYAHSVQDGSQRLIVSSSESVGLSTADQMVVGIGVPHPPPTDLHHRSSSGGPPRPPELTTEENNTSGLVEAQPVRPVEELLETGELVRQDPDDLEDGTGGSSGTKGGSGSNGRRKRPIWMILLLWVGLVVAVLSVAVPLLVLWANNNNKKAKNSSSESTTSENGNNNTVYPPQEDLSPKEYLEQFLPPETLANINSIDYDSNTTMTPQSLAFDWLVQDPSLTLYSTKQLKQRFALATFYYATTQNGTEPWIHDKFWLSYNHHECEWSITSIIDRVYGGPPLITKPPCDNYTTTANNNGELSPIATDNKHYDFVRLWQREMNLHGTLPEEIYWLTNLQSLDFGYRFNMLGGTISKNIAKMSNLVDILLDLVQLSNVPTATIPTELATLSKLTNLRLSGTNFEGTIPPELFTNLTNLEQIGFVRSRFTGSIPTQVGLATNLISFSHARAGLGGSRLPTELGLLKKLNFLYVFYNGFAGSLPTQIGLLSDLYWLGAQGNSFTGPFPQEFCQLKNLQELRLFRNQLSGPIPSCVGGLPRLTLMQLASNQLSGSIPSQLGNLSRVEELTLDHNELTGSIPRQLGHLGAKDSLQVLSLAHNRIRGSIPTSLGLFGNLQEANWNDNALTGAIPSELGLWNGSLTIWDVSINDLSGSIPVEISSWWNNKNNDDAGQTELTFFNVSGNDRLTGTIPEGLCKTLNATYLGFDCNGLLCGCDCQCPTNNSSTGFGGA